MDEDIVTGHVTLVPSLNAKIGNFSSFLVFSKGVLTKRLPIADV